MSGKARTSENPRQATNFSTRVGCNDQQGGYMTEFMSFVNGITEANVKRMNTHHHKEDTCKYSILSGSVRPYQCTFCEYKAVRKDTILKHFKTKHDDNAEYYKCKFCNYRTKLKERLRTHFISKHNISARLYQCNQTVCDDHKEYSASEVIENVSTIKEERFDDLEDAENDTKEINLNYECIEVEKTEDVKYMITAADVSSSGVGCDGENSGQATSGLDVFHNQTGCDDNKEYSASEYVSNIKEEENDREDEVMDIDGKYRAEKIADNKDSILAEDTCKDGNLSKSLRPYQCGFCEYKAKTKYTLWIHFKLKHDDNPEWYECQFCEYRTKLKRSLRKHIRQQHDAIAEWFQCKCCAFRTKDKHSLRDHFTVKHDIDAELLQCQRCAYKTKNKDMLACHLISKHPSTEGWYQCQLCEYGTKYKSDFKKHFEYKHDQGAEHHHCVAFVSLNKK